MSHSEVRCIYNKLNLFTSMYHSEVRCIYNKLNPLYIYVSQWSTLHLQQT